MGNKLYRQGPNGPILLADFEGLYPVGAVKMWAGAKTGASVPSGWLLCDASAVSRTTYAALFAVIGTSYGPGDGSTSFNVPNLNALETVSGITLTANTRATTSPVSGIQSADHSHNGTSGAQSPTDHTHNGTSGDNSVGHTHNTTANSGNQSANHTHTWDHDAGETGNADTNLTSTANSAAHTHGWSATTTGGIVNNHTHNTTTGVQSADHTHNTTTGTQSADHTHNLGAVAVTFLIKY